MKKNLHSIQINVFEKNNLEIQSIMEVYNRLLPIDHKKEKIRILDEKLEGFKKKIIHSITLKTNKNRHNNLLLDSIFLSLNDKDIKTIYNQIESRLDNDGNFFIRLDKQSLIDNHFVLTDYGDCFHIKIRLAGYPANRKNYIDSITELLQHYINIEK